MSLVEGRDLSSFSIEIRGKEGKAHIFSTFLDHFSLEILNQRNAGETSGEKRRGDGGERGKGRRRGREGTESRYPEEKREKKTVS